jgi:hypothetical protein
VGEGWEGELERGWRGREKEIQIEYRRNKKFDVMS